MINYNTHITTRITNIPDHRFTIVSQLLLDRHVATKDAQKTFQYKIKLFSNS